MTMSKIQRQSFGRVTGFGDASTITIAPQTISIPVLSVWILIGAWFAWAVVTTATGDVGYDASRR